MSHHLRYLQRPTEACRRPLVSKNQRFVTGARCSLSVYALSDEQGTALAPAPSRRTRKYCWIFHSPEVYAGYLRSSTVRPSTSGSAQGGRSAHFPKVRRYRYGVAYSQHLYSPSRRASKYGVDLHALLSHRSYGPARRRIGPGGTGPRLRAVAPGTMETDVRAQSSSSAKRSFRLHPGTISFRIQPHPRGSRRRQRDPRTDSAITTRGRSQPLLPCRETPVSTTSRELQSRELELC